VWIGQTGVTGEHGSAVVIGAAGVDGGFVDDQIAGFEDFADGFGGLEQGAEVRAFGVIDRSTVYAMSISRLLVAASWSRKKVPMRLRG
jgi:hypothetical protein